MLARMSDARLAGLLLLLLLLITAASAAGSRELLQQGGAALPPAAEAQGGGDSGVGAEAPPAGPNDLGLEREGAAAEEFAVDQSGGEEQAGDVPPGNLPADDVAALLGSEAAALGGSSRGSGSSGGDLFGSDGTAEDQPAVQPTDPSKRIGRAISLLRPPPGFIPPELSQEQRDMIPKLQKARQGAATVAASREVGNLAAASLNCGIAYLNDHYRTHYVGIPSELYRKGELCGACVRMWCVDSICENALVNNTLFMVADSCQDCAAGNLVVSPAGLRSLSGGVNVDANPTLQVAWAFESCAPLITGGIRLWPSDRTSPEFLGLQLSNVRGLIKGATLNGIDLQRTDYGYWVIDTPGKNIPLRPPYELVLVSTSNQRIGKRLNSLRAQDLGINFG